MVSLEDHSAGKKVKQGRWTEEEQRLFAEAVQTYGKRWKKLEQVMGTRTSTQCRSHGQKYFLKLKKEQVLQGLQVPSPPKLSSDQSSPASDSTDLEALDNNQLRQYLDELLKTNVQLTKEIQRLRWAHTENSSPEAVEPLPVKHPSAGGNGRKSEVKVIFRDESDSQ